MNWELNNIRQVFIDLSYGDNKKVIVNLYECLLKYEQNFNDNIECLSRINILKQLIKEFKLSCN